MATLDKNFRIKNGLVVEGSTATVNGNSILTENASDQYILNLIGGETLVKSVDSNLTVDVNGKLSINRTVVDTWYDEAGSASTVQTNLDNHTNSSSVHGVTGNVVGTSDVQSLSNKTFTGQVNFQSGGGAGGTNNYIDVDNASGKLTLKSGYALDITSSNDIQITSNGGDIDLRPDGNATVWGNVIATQTWVGQNYDSYGAASAAESNAKSYADGLVSTEVTNRNSAIATAKSEAINAASQDATSKANSAEQNAKNYADSLASNYDAAGAATTAYNNAVSTASSDATSKANLAEQNAKSYTDQSIGTLVFSNTVAGEINAVANGTLQQANQYTDGKVSDLVNSAPALLDTLGELATALQNNPDVITNIQNVAAGKQDTLTAGEGIYIDNANVITGRQQSGGGLKFVGNEAAIDRSTVDAWYDPSGAATTAENNAKSYADGVAFTAEQNANTYTNNAISQGLQGYVTETGTETLTNKTLTDPKISGNIELLDGNGTYVAYISSTNDSLVIDTDSQNIILNPEAANAYIGSVNSNNEIAIKGDLNNVLAGSTSFTELAISWIRKDVASYAWAPNTAQVTAYAWNSSIPTGKFIVRVRNGVHSQASEIMITRDNSNNIAISEYGIVTTNGILADLTASYNATTGQIEILATPAHATGTEILIAGTLLAYGD